jgi:hypothetical protein
MDFAKQLIGLAYWKIMHRSCLDTRKVRNDWTFQYNGRIFQIEDQRPAVVKPKDIVAIYERLDGSLYLKKGSNFLDYKEIKQRFKPAKREPKPYIKRKTPWRYSNSMFYTKKGHFHFAKEQDIITLP